MYQDKNKRANPINTCLMCFFAPSASPQVELIVYSIPDTTINRTHPRAARNVAYFIIAQSTPETPLIPGGIVHSIKHHSEPSAHSVLVLFGASFTFLQLAQGT